ncbi:HNH endonuclease [Sporosarcina sp. G11-34]|uniref:HNH endonuclease n=1 Tax=Sporosarcina sp. G11-34 TaxID=2849605 RepID=UPI0022A935AF|nr:hypothetical protein [Sporosarcina sp. G11-34]MCZ2259849.1 hypothetical protein [Sporosarcina sp. G11-34]
MESSTSPEYEYFTLKIEAKPNLFSGSSVRKAISPYLWGKKIRPQVLKDCNYTCQICGFQPGKDEYRNVHVHEIEEFDFENVVIILKGLDLICQKCHQFHHIVRMYKVNTKEQIDDLILHFQQVNECDYIDYRGYKLEREVHSMIKHKDKQQKLEEGQIMRYKIAGDIPFKDEVIAKLRENYLYFED